MSRFTTLFGFGTSSFVFLAIRRDKGGVDDVGERAVEMMAGGTKEMYKPCSARDSERWRL